MEIKQFELRSINPFKSSHRKAFVALPFDLAVKYPQWNPGLRLYHEQVLDPKKNPFWSTTNSAFFIVTKGKAIVGRMGILAPGYIKEQPDASVIAFPDFIEDLHLFQEMIEKVEEQAKQWGATALIGPLNPNIHYEVGVQIDGFHNDNAVFMGYQPPYYSSFFEASGFTTLADFSAWYLYKKNFTAAENLQALVDKVMENKNIYIRAIDLKEFDNELKLFHQLYSNSFSNHWGFTAPSWEEFKFLGNDLKYVLKNKLALVAEYKGEPVGFVLAIPNLNDLLKKSSAGKISFPFLLSLIYNYRKIDTVRVMIAGILPDFRHLGIHIPLFQKIALNIFEIGYSGGEISWVKDDNEPMNKILKKLGARKTKTYRIYSKSIG